MAATAKPRLRDLPDVAPSGAPGDGQVPVYSAAAGRFVWGSGGGGGPPVSDASTTVKGVSKLSTAPAVAANPVAVGDNDPRNSDARAPTAHTHPQSDVTGLAGALGAKADQSALTAHTGDVVLDGGPHGFPALTGDGMGWLRVGGALVAVDLATQAELDAGLALKQDAATAATDAELAAHTGRTDNPHGVTKAQVGLGSADNTSDAAKPVSTAAQAALDLKADLVGGKVPSGQLPAVATGQTVTVASQAAMLALTTSQVQPGDVAIRSDQSGRRWLLAAADPSVLANWIQLEVPDAVSSVNGQQGAVVLAAGDVGAQAAGAAAGGDLSGTYPNPAIGPNAVTQAKASIGSGATQLAGGDDARFPSSGQKNALAGLHGTPGTGNEYATKQSIGAAGTAGKALAADDPVTTNSRAPSGAAGGDLNGTFPNPTLAQKVEELTTGFSMASPAVMPIPPASFTVRVGSSAAGQFVARSTTVRIRVQGSLRLYGSGESFVNFALVWQDQTANPGYTGQLIPLKTGVKNDPSVSTPVYFGHGQAPNVTVGGVVVLTGLTVGHTYRYEIGPAVLGAMHRLRANPGERQWSLGVSPKRTAPPLVSHVLVSRSQLLPATTKGRIGVWTIARTHNAWQDNYLGSVEMPDNTSTQGRVAVTPDGTRAVVTSLFAPASGGPAVTVIDTGLPAHRSSHQPAYPGGPLLGLAYTEPSGIGASAPSLFNPSVYNGNVLAATDGPNAVAITPDGKTALIGIRTGTNAGKVAKLTIATGAVTYSAQLAAAATPSDISIDAAGTYAYVSSDGTDKKVYKVQISDLSVPASSAALGQAPTSCVVDNTGFSTSVYAVGGAAGSATLYTLPTSLASAPSFNLAATYSTLQPSRCALMPDGRTLMIVSNGPADVNAIIQFDIANQTFFQGWAGVIGGDYTANFTNGSNALTAVTKTAGWAVSALVPGLPLSGTGIPANTFIGAVDADAATMTMVTATGAVSNFTGTTGNQAFHSYNPVNDLALSANGDLFFPDRFGEQIVTWGGLFLYTDVESWVGTNFVLHIEGGV